MRDAASTRGRLRSVLRGRATTLLGAMLLEGALAYPAALWRAIGHPVSWIGALLHAADRRWNDDRLAPGRRRARGRATLGLAIGVAAIGGKVVGRVGGLAGRTVGLATLLAARSLHDHVQQVADALDAGAAAHGDLRHGDLRHGDLREARRAVGRIVGRDTAELDRHAIARAAIESLAENFSDGVVAPALAFLAGGLPGAAIYKAVNTADSMIGHRTARHRDFGRASARLDDWLNLPASRLAAMLLAAASGRPRRAWRTVQRDARRHRSPNAGWPEAALAGALGFRLNGPRRYGGAVRADAWTGDGRDALDAADIRRALRLYRRAIALGLVFTLPLLGRRGATPPSS